MWNPNSFEDREVPPMSAEMFRALVTSRLRPVQGVEIVGGKGLQLKVRVLGLETNAQLERAYERYRANPERLTPVIEEFISGLVNGTGDERAGNEEFAKVKDMLRPRLITAQQWMKRRDDGLRLVVRSIAQDLGAALILDEGESFEYVQLDSIPAWDVDSQAAYEAAITNLERETAGNHVSVNGEGVETLLVAHWSNAAAELVSRARMEDWEAQIEGQLVIGVPTHDLMLGFALEHPAFEDLRAQVAEDAEASPNGLLGSLLRVREGALELLS